MALTKLQSPEDAARWLRERVTGTLRQDSRQVQPGDGFIAWPGAATDGRRYVPQALAAGAAACLVEHHKVDRYGFDDPRIATLAGLKAATGPVALAMVLSSSAKTPIANLAISNGLRPGLAMLIKQLADEIGPAGGRVVGLLPGTIYTDRIKFLHSQGDDPEATRAAAAASIPLRRLGDPIEFGRVAAFLLSPAASYVTGSLVAIDGGVMRAL